MNWRALWVPLAGTALAALATALYGVSNFTWAGWQPSPCAPRCFCEALQPGAIFQPQSIYSNLAYVFVGLLILAAAPAGGGPRRNRLTQQPAYARSYGLAVIAIGLTSEFYHLSLTQIGRWLDYLGMYLFASWCLLYALARLRPVPDRVFAAGYLGLNAGLGGLWWLLPTLALKRWLFGGLILGILAVELPGWWRRRGHGIQAGYCGAAFGMLAVGLVVNLWDEAGGLCSPQSWWQWHAVWHYLTAAAAGCLYLYYRSETGGLPAGGLTPSNST